jgi:hypothetical protein
VIVRYRPSPSEDDERIKAFVANGASIIRAAALKRKKDILRARKIGCTFPPLRIARRKWAETPANR